MIDYEAYNIELTNIFFDSEWISASASGEYDLGVEENLNEGGVHNVQWNHMPQQKVEANILTTNAQDTYNFLTFFQSVRGQYKCFHFVDVSNSITVLAKSDIAILFSSEKVPDKIPCIFFATKNGNKYIRRVAYQDDNGENLHIVEFDTSIPFALDDIEKCSLVYLMRLESDEIEITYNSPESISTSIKMIESLSWKMTLYEPKFGYNIYSLNTFNSIGVILTDTPAPHFFLCMFRYSNSRTLYIYHNNEIYTFYYTQAKYRCGNDIIIVDDYNIPNIDSLDDLWYTTNINNIPMGWCVVTYNNGMNNALINENGIYWRLLYFANELPQIVYHQNNIIYVDKNGKIKEIFPQYASSKELEEFRIHQYCGKYLFFRAYGSVENRPTNFLNFDTSLAVPIYSDYTCASNNTTEDVARCYIYEPVVENDNNYIVRMFFSKDYETAYGANLFHKDYDPVLCNDSNYVMYRLYAYKRDGQYSLNGYKTYNKIQCVVNYIPEIGFIQQLNSVNELKTKLYFQYQFRYDEDGAIYRVYKWAYYWGVTVASDDRPRANLALHYRLWNSQVAPGYYKMIFFTNPGQETIWIRIEHYKDEAVLLDYHVIELPDTFIDEYPIYYIEKWNMPFIIQPVIHIWKTYLMNGVIWDGENNWYSTIANYMIEIE